MSLSDVIVAFVTLKCQDLLLICETIRKAYIAMLKNVLSLPVYVISLSLALFILLYEFLDCMYVHAPQVCLVPVEV